MSSSAFTPQNNITGIADGSTAGIVSTVAQTFAGDKTFTGKVISDTLQAATTGGLLFKENDGTTTGTVSDAGAWTLGPSATTSNNITHVLQAGNGNFTTVYPLRVNNNDSASGAGDGVGIEFAFAGLTLARIRSQHDGSSQTSLRFDVQTAGGPTITESGSITGSGSWTLGPSGFTGTHNVNARIVEQRSDSTSASTYTQWKRGSTSGTFVGIAGFNDAIVTGTQTGDAIFLSSSGRLVFGNTGSTIYGTVTTAGYWRLGSGSSSLTQTNAAVSARFNGSGNSVEWGHPNQAGYGCVLGYETGSGNPFIGFSCEHGSTSSTYRTRGFQGAIISGGVNNGLLFRVTPNANADNQTASIMGAMYLNGNWEFGPSGSTTNGHLFNGYLQILGRPPASNAQAYFTSSGLLGVVGSSRRYKTNIENLGTEINWEDVYQLRPVEFDYIDPETANRKCVGLIAEEVEPIIPSLVRWDQGQIESVHYQDLPILLLKAIQDLKLQLDEAKAKIAILEAK